MQREAPGNMSDDTFTSGDGPNDRHFINCYREHTNKEIVRWGRIAAVLAFVAYLYFIFQDYVIVQLPGLFKWRAIGLGATIVFLLFTFTKFVKIEWLTRILFDLFLLAAVTQACGIIPESNFAPGAVSGFSVIIFAAVIFFRGSVIDLALIYGLPLTALIVSLVAWVKPDVSKFSMLSNPITFAIVGWVVGWIQYRMRLHEFRADWKAETERRISDELVEKMENELRIAAKIQYSLIPHVPPKVDGLEFSMFFLPMEAIGGDYFDFIDLRSEGAFGVFLSDVSGHGVPASLIASMMKTLVMSSTDNRLVPNEFLIELNTKIYGLSAGNFVAVFYGVYFFKTRKLVYCTATQTFPFVLRDGSIIKLKGRGSMLGFFPDLNFDVYEFECTPGDRILFYTDGLIETFNRKGEVFQRYVDASVLRHEKEEQWQFLKSVFRDLSDFSFGKFEDDICMIAMDVK
ncbi:MAG: hypothetical protein A2Y33_07285 [Spirochaetes bacterium GWF1_51_8]|nr:MAG: hypothetical protein A2Y33_07285 [Spirochaetes bacterium GWF1_51_8]